MLRMRPHALIVPLLVFSLAACRGASPANETDPGPPMADTGIPSFKRSTPKSAPAQKRVRVAW